MTMKRWRKTKKTKRDWRAFWKFRIPSRADPRTTVMLRMQKAFAPTAPAVSPSEGPTRSSIFVNGWRFLVVESCRRRTDLTAYSQERWGFPAHLGKMQQLCTQLEKTFMFIFISSSHFRELFVWAHCVFYIKTGTSFPFSIGVTLSAFPRRFSPFVPLCPNLATCTLPLTCPPWCKMSVSL